jgi:hypothetical protein
MGGPNGATLHGWASDFFVAQWQGVGWGPPQRIPPPLNSALHEKEFGHHPDGQSLWFGRYQLTPKWFQTCDLWASPRLADSACVPRWGPPAPIEALNTPEWCECYPAWSADGQTLWFVSNRPGGQGDHDILYTHRRTDGTWDGPHNPGPPINSTHRELDVHPHPTNPDLLFFCSDRTGGIGKQDIWLSRRSGGQWQPPINLGFHINTPGNDLDVFLAAEGHCLCWNHDWPEAAEGHQGLSDMVCLGAVLPPPSCSSPASAWRLWFGFDSAEVRPQYGLMLDSLALWLRANPQARVHLAGHTDGLGNHAYNLALSEARVNATAEVLRKRMVPLWQIRRSWHAATQPDQSNDSDKGRAQNRRVEVWLE